EGNLFNNSLNSTDNDYYRSGNIEKLSVSKSALFNAPAISDDSKIAVMNTSGTVYLFESNGTLLMAKSMGQNPSKNWQPIIVDINNDGSLDVVALAAYGRLYAWNIETGERIHQLPTAAMHHVTIGDI